ncbi:MAG TPA: hypothetical protein VM734_09570 [Kofleriaceae bacterium]|nr:hypothetical protein [Kofleriaceae bacterium]
MARLVLAVLAFGVLACDRVRTAAIAPSMGVTAPSPCAVWTYN